MQKLEKRQVVILGIMVVVILFGAYNFFAGSTAKRTSPPALKNQDELNSFVSGVSAGIGKNSLSAGETYVMGRAEGEWLRNPFYERKAYGELFKSQVTAKTEADTKKVTFDYSGYTVYQGKEVAIINGLEYSPGEKLDVPGYSLTKIFPEKVIIENRDDKIKIEVPIQD
jgi:hypothetical protein